MTNIEVSEIFYKKPGKLGATTVDVWVDLLARRGILNPETEVRAMIADARLIQTED